MQGTATLTGTVRITDVWDVDNPERRLPDGRIADLAEGGRKATQVFDIATSLGTYRPMPIDIQLTADQWADAQRSKSSQAERDKTMNTYVYENKNNPSPEQFGPFPAPPAMSDEQQKKMMESFFLQL